MAKKQPAASHRPTCPIHGDPVMILAYDDTVGAWLRDGYRVCKPPGDWRHYVHLNK